MASKPGRYSYLIRPLSYLTDTAIIILFALQFRFTHINFVYYILFVCFGWLFLSFKSKFYEIYRFTKITKIFIRGVLQFTFFSLIVFSFFGIFQNLQRPLPYIIVYIVKVSSTILICKIGSYYLLRHYRKQFGGNNRTTVIVGNTLKTQELKHFFLDNPYYGYFYKKTFDIAEEQNTTKAKDSLKECCDYILKEGIDEIYCSASALSNTQIKALVGFADNNLKVLKFIPDNRDIHTKQLKLQYYEYFPILSFRSIPIKSPLNKLIKRIFDIIFSLLVIILVMSWLTPILAILIKLSSKGPVFFKQPRNGLNYKEFSCYKFRSMKVNTEANTRLMSKNDTRVTRIGNFMRKTSIDELPQFFNVLMGNMSTVGPRPHMVSVSNIYAENIDKFMVRHFVKPGITGLAQVSGYRGEMKNKSDVINRVRYDIFYVENWSLALDVKIIIETIVSSLKGDKDAY